MADLTPAEMASMDQMHAGAMELARTLVGQWAIYGDAGMPEAMKWELVSMYLAATLEPPIVEVTLEDD